MHRLSALLARTDLWIVPSALLARTDLAAAVAMIGLARKASCGPEQPSLLLGCDRGLD